jgi:signal transduction histidine kinase
VIEDDGIGIPEDVLGRPASHGLVGMRERARLLGGTLVIESAPGNGTAVAVRVPLDVRQAPAAVEGV